MSGYWEVIAPVAILGFGAVVALARRLRHPPGTHADRAHLRLAPLDATPDTLARWGTVPVAEVEGEPPWEPEHGPGSLGTWFPHDGHVHQCGCPVCLGRCELMLRRELHHVDDLDPGPGAGLYLSPGYNSRPDQSESTGSTRMKADSPAPDDLPREDGAGDESEACGPPAPPAPLRPVDLALARCDLFMVAMRADHAQWLSAFREGWAAA